VDRRSDRFVAGCAVNAHAGKSSALSVDAMRAALAEGARVALDLALIASADASRVNLDALIAQLSGLQSTAARLRGAIDSGAP